MTALAGETRKENNVWEGWGALGSGAESEGRDKIWFFIKEFIHSIPQNR